MITEAKRAWMVNAMLVLLLGLAVYLKIGASPAQAAGSGMQTDGMMLTAGGADEKLVVVNTTEKKIMLYKTKGYGEFRLLSARSYEFDQRFQADTSKVKDIESRGYTATQAAELYGQRPQK